MKHGSITFRIFDLHEAITLNELTTDLSRLRNNETPGKDSMNLGLF
jgi:hypothetical protein